MCYLQVVELTPYVRPAGRFLYPSTLIKMAEEGRALTETRFPTLNERVAEMVQGVIDLATKAEKGRAA